MSLAAGIGSIRRGRPRTSFLRHDSVILFQSLQNCDRVAAADASRVAVQSLRWTGNLARPREFTDEKVLDAAIDCFWQRGLGATSVRDLTSEMGINGPSLLYRLQTVHSWNTKLRC